MSVVRTAVKAICISALVNYLNMNKRLQESVAKNTAFVTQLVKQRQSCVEQRLVEHLASENAKMKEDYESFKFHLQNLTKDHLVFFETFHMNFLEQEKALKAISDVTGQLEDEIVKRTQVIIEKQEYIENLKASLISSQKELQASDQKKKQSVQISILMIFMIFVLALSLNLKSTLSASFTF